MTILRSRHSGGFSVYNPKYKEPPSKPLTWRQKLFVAVFGLIAVGITIMFTVIFNVGCNYFIKNGWVL